MPQLFYQDRTLSGVLARAARQFPAVVLTGPRQSGKTTIVRHHFHKTHRYCSLDDPAIREQASSDAQLLLSRFPPPVILDEIQYAPELLHYVKLNIDEHRSAKGRFVITGSQAFPLMEKVTESLAGRAAVLSLLSMSARETLRRAEPQVAYNDLLWPKSSVPSPRAPPRPEQMADWILRGGFPEPALDQNLDFKLWHSGYVQTYLERDVRSLRAVGDLGDFQRFLFALGARTGSLLNSADLARDLAVSGKTIKAWISVLEASGQAVTLKPYFASLGKRLVKRPKVYFLDTGTLAYLLGLDSPNQVLQGIAAGPMFEAAVLGQLYRGFLHRGETPRIYFWRTSAGHEVDFVIDAGRQLIPVEAKLTATPRSQDAAGIEEFQRLFRAKAGHGIVACLCKERFPLTRSVDAVPFGSF